MMEKGQVFYADYAKPEGFCDEARKAIYQYVFALSHVAGKEVFYYRDWIRKPGAVTTACVPLYLKLRLYLIHHDMLSVHIALSIKRKTKLFIQADSGIVSFNHAQIDFPAPVISCQQMKQPG